MTSCRRRCLGSGMCQGTSARSRPARLRRCDRSYAHQVLPCQRRFLQRLCEFPEASPERVRRSVGGPSRPTTDEDSTRFPSHHGFLSRRRTDVPLFGHPGMMPMGIIPAAPVPLPGGCACDIPGPRGKFAALSVAGRGPWNSAQNIRGVPCFSGQYVVEKLRRMFHVRGAADEPVRPAARPAGAARRPPRRGRRPGGCPPRPPSCVRPAPARLC